MKRRRLATVHRDVCVCVCGYKMAGHLAAMGVCVFMCSVNTYNCKRPEFDFFFLYIYITNKCKKNWQGNLH